MKRLFDLAVAVALVAAILLALPICTGVTG